MTHPVRNGEPTGNIQCEAMRGSVSQFGRRAAQTFIRWARLGVWERLLNLVQERGIQLGMTFLDGTSVRAHQKAAGARRKGALKLNETIVKHLVALVTAMAPRLA